MYANPLSGYISFHHSPGSADGLWERKHRFPIHCINLKTEQAVALLCEEEAK